MFAINVTHNYHDELLKGLPSQSKQFGGFGDRRSYERVHSVPQIMGLKSLQISANNPTMSITTLSKSSYLDVIFS